MTKSLLEHSLEGNRDDLILKTIQDILTEVFGEKSFRKMRQTMKQSYSLEWYEVPLKSDVFSSALRRILGSGSVIIEDLIIENLYSNLGLELRWKKGFSFPDYIAQLPSASRTVSRR